MPRSRIDRLIKRLREARGWTPSALARKPGLFEPAHVSILESGGRHDSSASTLQRFAKAVGVPVAALLQ